VYARSTRLRLHRVIVSASSSDQVDHENGNGLDNRRHNLRHATVRKNSHNVPSHRDSTSRFKGVCWVTKQKRWQAQIYYNGKNINLGVFDDEEIAAMVYDLAAIKNFGSYARLNFPEIPEFLLRTSVAMSHLGNCHSTDMTCTDIPRDVPIDIQV
jgi:AP2 domain